MEQATKAIEAARLAALAAAADLSAAINALKQEIIEKIKE